MARIGHIGEPRTSSNAGASFVARVQRDGTLLDLTMSNSDEEVGALIGRNLYDILPDDLALSSLQHITTALASGQPYAFVYEQTNATTSRAFDVSLMAANADEVVAFGQDITERARAQEDALALNRSLLSLQSAAAAITASLNLEHVLDTFVWEMTNLLDVDGCAISRWDAAQDSVKLLAVYPEVAWTRTGAFDDAYALTDFPLTKQVLQERYAQQIVLEEAGARPVNLPEATYMRGRGLTRLLMLPLVFQGQVIGLVEVLGRQANALPFSDQAISLGQLLTNEAASAVANAQLYDEAQRRLREQTALRRASAIIASTLDLPTVLNYIAEQMAWATDATSAYMFSVAPDSAESIILGHYVSPHAGQLETFTDLTQQQNGATAAAAQLLPAGDAHVWQHGAPDVPAPVSAFMQRYGAKTCMAVPVLVGGDLTALACLFESRWRRPFVEEDINLTRGIAQQAAIAIENARLYEQLDRRVEELAALNRISQAITSTLDLQESLTIITRNTLELLRVEGAAVALLHTEENHIRYAAASGSAQQDKDRVFQTGEGTVGRAIATGMPVLRPDSAENSPASAAEPAVLCVPLTVKGQTIGAISVSSTQRRQFGEEEVRLLTLLAAPAATAIENARLYQQARLEIEERMRAEAALEAERASLTERVAARTSDLRTANAELARAARLKDEFLASMSHELRTPLNAILLISQGMQEQIYGTLNGRQRESMHVVEESGQHLLSLINDILDVAKIESGQLALELETVDVRSICEASLQFVKQPATQKNIRVRHHIDDRLTTLVADGRRLKQILINLLSNAVKFTPGQGAIGLDVTGDPARGVIDFVVWDTGIGIETSAIDQLFQPFVQLDSSLSRRYQGTGLGLTLVRRMAEMHGGDIYLESTPGEGSRFTVSLPWQGSAENANPPQHPASYESGQPPFADARADQPTILLADDDETNLDIFSDVLQTLGYRVTIARNGLEAVHSTLKNNPDLILMDIQMPEMDGLEAMRTIRADKSIAHIPIFALTALAMKGDRERCLQAGANEYLSKPVSLQALEQALRTYLPVQTQPSTTE